MKNIVIIFNSIWIC